MPSQPRKPREPGGAEEAGVSHVRAGDLGDLDAAVRDIARSEPDLVLLLLADWRSELDFLSRYESSGLTPAVTGFPSPVTQTRHFYYASRQAAPVAGSGHRAALWEATLDAYGARELNARFAARWGQPMDPPAWSAYQAVKIAFETPFRDVARARRVADIVFGVRARLPERVAHELDERAGDEARLPGPGYARHRRERTDGKARAHTVEVVERDIPEREPSQGLPRAMSALHSVREEVRCSVRLLRAA